MEVCIVQNDSARTFPVKLPCPLNLPDGQLVVGLNVSEKGRKVLPKNTRYDRVSEYGIDFHLGLPRWMHRPDSTGSRSKGSHAKYLATADLTASSFKVGVLLQILGAGRETSCHSHPCLLDIDHPGTEECFFPLSDGPTPILHTPGEKKSVPQEGCCVPVGTVHQLQAPPDTSTLTLIVMWPMPSATWMAGHVPHEPPFVPYTE